MLLPQVLGGLLEELPEVGRLNIEVEGQNVDQGGASPPGPAGPEPWEPWEPTRACGPGALGDTARARIGAHPQLTLMHPKPEDRRNKW